MMYARTQVVGLVSLVSKIGSAETTPNAMDKAIRPVDIILMLVRAKPPIF